MRFILNIIWLVLCGLWMAIGYALAGLICFALFFLVITIPFGIAAFRIAGYVLWPFGRSIDRRPRAGVASLIGNILWIILLGWELALAHLVTGVLLCLTIIGIPLGLANFKIPRYVELTDTFPMTVTGKVQKFRMRELSAERLGATVGSVGGGSSQQ